MSLFYSPQELLTTIGERAKECRLATGRRQVDIAKSAGVPVSTLKRFEAGSNVGLDVVVRLALVLGAERDLANLFASPEPGSMDELLKRNRRRIRGKRMS